MLGGYGIGLPLVGNLGPSLPISQPYSPNASRFDIPAGGALYVPAGWWMVRLGLYTMVQFLDPYSGIWLPFSTVGGRQMLWLNSDGSNFRIVNATGTMIGAVVSGNGTGYAQSSTTCAASVGASTWLPVVGNSVTAIAVGSDPAGNAGGTNFTLPPIVDIQAPPPGGGVSASASATISGGAVTAVTMLSQGAAFNSGVPTATIRPNPFDPNIGTITVPKLTATLGGGTTASGGVNALLCTNYGQVLSGTQMASATLTISGAGSSATAVPIFCMTVTGVAFSGSGGGGYPGSYVEVKTVGGMVQTAQATVANAGWSTALMLPRQADIYAPVSAGAVGAAIINDGGVFQIAPAALVIAASAASAGLPTTATAATLTMGSSTDSVYLQNMGSAF